MDAKIDLFSRLTCKNSTFDSITFTVAPSEFLAVLSLKFSHCESVPGPNFTSELASSTLGIEAKHFGTVKKKQKRSFEIMLQTGKDRGDLFHTER